MSPCALLKKPKSNALGVMPSKRWPAKNKKHSEPDAPSLRPDPQPPSKPSRAPKTASKPSAKSAWPSSEPCVKNAPARPRLQLGLQPLLQEQPLPQQPSGKAIQHSHRSPSNPAPALKPSLSIVPSQDRLSRWLPSSAADG